MRFLPVFLLAFCCTVNAYAVRLPASVRHELRDAGIPLSAVAVEVTQAGKRVPLIRVHAGRPMNPASTMKLFTTFAALDLLGPAYSWKTEAYVDGTLKDGVLDGNLILKGYGDPKFTVEQFWLWLSELRTRGLRDIRGDLVLDRSYFDLPPYDPGEFDDDPTRAYNVGPDALLVNFNTVRFRYLVEGPELKVFSEPRLDGVTLDNKLTPSVSRLNCNYWDDQLSVQPRGDSVVFQGDYPVGCGERVQTLSVMPHTRYVGALFGALWRELGGTLQGKEREGVVSDRASLFSTHYSEPLASAIRDINKFSNNVMARQLFLTLGETLPDPFPEQIAPVSAAVAADDQAGFAEEPPPVGRMSMERSMLAMHAWMAQNYLDAGGMVIDNGAGLSRKARVSAAQITQLLQLAFRHPLSAEMQASLPILGVDGSARRRLRDSPAASHAHLKTGTLEGVKAVAGYVHSRSGKEWTVVFLINDPHAARGQDAQDALIEWLALK